MPQTQAQAQAPLSLAAATPLAQSLARREAHCPDDADDLVQVALFAFHKAISKSPTVENPYAHARTIMQRAMWGYYSGNSTQFTEKHFVELPDESTHMAPATRRRYHADYGKALALFAGLDGAPEENGTQAELFELQEYFDGVLRSCGRIAHTMVVNLVSPEGECSRKILEAAKAKQQVQKDLKSADHKARRSQPRGVQNEIRLSQRVIRNALNISPSEWNRNMERIREYTLQHFPAIGSMLAQQCAS